MNIQQCGYAGATRSGTFPARAQIASVCKEVLYSPHLLFHSSEIQVNFVQLMFSC